MAQVNLMTSLPEHALEVLRDRARHDGVPLGEWLARAIYDKATRDSSADPARKDAARRRRFIADTEAERLRHFHQVESA
ncbi:MAG: hypothetical protein HOV71_19530 [Hamadaea sp.]|uniref:hypothetical protein n=1 Tax=Hamadaea sp. NPDC050747 TaxID=3155789 RepID=UPI001796570D|nr:hypothetical protein [Hamadaea sp.]NUR50325.1 hypothetical protein [Hamadaea sp.]NUR72064.1 hypothetical protein [Hamadaea sp.]NUT04759.1 hypothetical protein [Hamadaea sp.]